MPSPSATGLKDRLRARPKPCLTRPLHAFPMLTITGMPAELRDAEPQPLLPETKYVANGGVHLAYQTLGEGSVDILGLAGFCTHCEHQWEDPSMARCLRRTAAIGRMVWFDRRGTGMSDPVAPSELPTLDDEVDD